MNAHYIFGAMFALSAFLIILLIWAWITSDEIDNDNQSGRDE